MAGLRVHIAASGERAIDVAHQVSPDLILMDIMMPGIDGPSTLKRMRDSPALAHIPVIFMTAKLLPAEVAHFLRLGAIGVIGKPFDPLTLCSDLFTLWNKSGMARGAAIAQGESLPRRVREKVRSLTDTFLERTSGDVVRLWEMLAHVERGEGSVLQEVERIAHTIHGTGAMFGFPKVSSTGAAIERLAMECAASPSMACEPAVLRQLMQCTEQLALAVASAELAISNGGERLF